MYVQAYCKARSLRFVIAKLSTRIMVKIQCAQAKLIFNDMKKYNSLVHCYRDFHFSNPLILRKSAPRWRLLGTATVNHAFSGNHNNFWHPGRLIDFPYHTYRPRPDQLQTLLLDLPLSLLQTLNGNKCSVGIYIRLVLLTDAHLIIIILNWLPPICVIAHHHKVAQTSTSTLSPLLVWPVYTPSMPAKQVKSRDFSTTPRITIANQEPLFKTNIKTVTKQRLKWFTWIVLSAYENVMNAFSIINKLMGDLWRYPCPVSVWPNIKEFLCRQAVWCNVHVGRNDDRPALHAIGSLDLH